MRSRTLRLRLARTVVVAIGAIVAAATGGVAAASPMGMAVTPTTVVADGAHDVVITATAPVLEAGVAHQTITQLFSRGKLHLASAAGVTAPSGWTVSYSADGSTWGGAPTSASAWAAVRGVRAVGPITSKGGSGGKQIAVGENEVESPPSGTFTSPAGSGDGWDVFFDGADHVYNVFHHDGPNYTDQGKVDCHTRTGDACGAGWPFAVTPLHTGERPTGWVDDATHHLWFPTNLNSGPSAGTGFACIDVSDMTTGPRWCAGTAEASFVKAGSSYATIVTGGYCTSVAGVAARYECLSGFAVSGTRMFAWDMHTGALICVDAAANGGLGAPCDGQPFSFTGITFGGSVYSTGWRSDLIEQGGLIYGDAGSTPTPLTASPATTYAVCFDPVVLAPCSGWETPKTLGGANTVIYPQPDASGSIQGVCFKVPTTLAAVSATCFDAGGGAITANAGLATSIKFSGTGSQNLVYDIFKRPQAAGSRVYWGSAMWTASGYLNCYDVSTSATCSGWPIAGVANYTLTVDPENENCLWKNTDSGVIGTYSSTGASTCSVGPSSVSVQPTVSAPRMGCSATSSVTDWHSFDLMSPAASAYSAATLTIRKADGAVLVSGGTTWSAVPFTGSPRSVDLQAINIADAGTGAVFEVRFRGRTDAASVKTALAVIGEPSQLCLTLRAVEACPAAGLEAPEPTDVTGGGEAVMSAGATTSFTSTTVALNRSAPASCPILPPPASPTPTPMGTVNATSAPVALPDYAKTQKGVSVRLLTLANDGASNGHSARTHSVRMRDPKTDTWVTSLTVDGEGTYALDPPTGDVVFTPISSFTGTATPVRYRFADSDGKVAESTLHVVVVAPPGPFANPDHVAGMRGQTLHLVPLYNDDHASTAFEPSTLRLRHPTTGAWVTTLTVRGEGTYTVSATTGKVAFKPLRSFVGTATPQTYTVSTTAGTSVTSTLHPVIRSADPFLAITTTAARARVSIGAQTTVTARICNSGTTTAMGTAARVPVPAAFAVVAAYGGRIGASDVWWTIGDLAPGACVAKRMVVRGSTRGRGVFVGAATATNAARATDPATVRVVGPAPPVTG